VAWLHLAAATRIIRAMPSTDKKQTLVWNRWITYLGTVRRADDPFLDSLNATKDLEKLKPVVVSAFAQALRTGQLQTKGRKSVVAGTVQDNIGSLVQTFRSNKRKDPTRDSDGRLSAILSRQYAGFKSQDPAPKRERAISLRVLKMMQDLAITEGDRHTADLAICAFFFACRSCEYLRVKGPRRTKTIAKGDIRFRKGRVILPHDSPDLHLADKVEVRFRDQKNRIKGAWRTAWATSDPDANPVASFARVVRRVAALPGSSDDTLIYNYTATNNRSLLAISDADMISALRAAVSFIGPAELGYEAADVGTHSIRSGAAMALVLSGHEAWRIMLAGRWQSQAFLVYIREQIQEFSKGVSERMIANPDFYHVPDIDTWAAETGENPHVHANIFDGNTNMPNLTFVH
jgi:hypothetical protein